MVEQFVKRDLESLSVRPSDWNDAAAGQALRVAMTRLALAIHARGPDLTRLPVGRLEEVLETPLQGKPDEGYGEPWWPNDGFWWAAPDKVPYYHQPFTPEQVRLLKVHTLVRLDPDVRFLHDSFVYYFVGVLGLCEWHRPGWPPRRGRTRLLPPEWARAVVTRMRERPLAWVPVAEFLGGGGVGRRTGRGLPAGAIRAAGERLAAGASRARPRAN